MSNKDASNANVQRAETGPRSLQYAPPPPERGKNKYDVFISYQSSDRGWALQLYDVFKMSGWEPFLDQFYVVAGQPLEVSLEEAMEASSSGVIIWSRNTKDSKWCRRERDAMANLKDDTGSFNYVFAQIDAEPLPLFARGDLYVTFERSNIYTGRTGPDELNLLKLLCGLRGVPLPADAVRNVQKALEDKRAMMDEIHAAQTARDVSMLRTFGTSDRSEILDLPELKLYAAELLIQMSEFDDALLVLHHVETHFPRSIRLRQLKGLALRRMERCEDSIKVLSELYIAGHADYETLSLLASAWSGLHDESGITLHLRKSRDLYQLVYEVEPDGFYAGINAAAKSIFLGEEVIANRIIDSVLPQLQENESYPEPYKSLLVAEMQLIRRNLDSSSNLYQKIIDQYFETYGSLLNRSYRQVKKLCRALRLSSKESNEVLKPFELLEELK